MFDSIFDLVFNSPLTDFINFVVSPETAVYVANTPARLFNTICNVFFNILDMAKPMFSDFGNHAINTFAFSLTDNFFNTIIGIIFGFFVFKFALGKVLDLIGRWLDPV